MPYEQIDPIHFERTYYLGPDKGAEKVYSLLVAAMERSALAGIVRYVFHDRERPRVPAGARRRAASRAHVLRRRGPSARRDQAQAPVEGRHKQELELALALIERITSDFDPSGYEDRYRERLLKVIRQKRKGGTIEAPEVEERTKAPDLLSALRESVERAQGGNDRGNNGRGRGNGKRGKADLGDLSVKELNNRARKLDIGGRSSMTKRELVSAIQKAER